MNLFEQMELTPKAERAFIATAFYEEQEDPRYTEARGALGTWAREHDDREKWIDASLRVSEWSLIKGHLNPATELYWIPLQQLLVHTLQAEAYRDQLPPDLYDQLTEVWRRHFGPIDKEN